MNIAKLLKLPLLIDSDEMSDLLSTCEHSIYIVGQLLPKKELIISKEMFLESYRTYIAALMQGIEPEKLFAPAFSATEDAFKTITSDQRSLLKAVLPVVQMQPHTIDSQFRSMVYGTDVISWGVQFSYPMLFHNPITEQVEKVDDSFPNTPLFGAFRKWVRHNTVPSPFLVDGKRRNIPIRLGKKCFSWIANHPGLKKRGMSIVC